MLYFPEFYIRCKHVSDMIVDVYRKKSKLARITSTQRAKL